MSSETSARVNIAANLGGMTLKSLLENPSVLKPPSESNHNAEKDQKQLDWSKDADPTLIASAFLGPNLWNKTIAVDSDDFKDFKLEYMDLDEFLAENGIPVNPEDDQSAGLPTTSQSVMQHSPPPTYTTMTTMQSAIPYGQHPTSPPLDLTKPSTSGGHYRQQLSPTPGVSPPHIGPDDIIPEVDVSLNTGAKEDFDPRKRTFTDDELKPQPMMKKSKKVYVPTDLKDDRYWQRRQKNNMAAKRSRDARRVKENQIAMRAGYLEKENNALKQELLKVKEENAYLKKKLAKYEL